MRRLPGEGTFPIVLREVGPRVTEMGGLIIFPIVLPTSCSHLKPVSSPTSLSPETPCPLSQLRTPWSTDTVLVLSFSLCPQGIDPYPIPDPRVFLPLCPSLTPDPGDLFPAPYFRRNQNYLDILRLLSLGDRQLSAFDISLRFTHLFWFGDLNYRLDMDIQVPAGALPVAVGG